MTAFKVVKRVMPKPPTEPLRGSGFACVHATIDVTGRAEDVEVVNTNHPPFANAFLRAVQQWRFEPATRAGVPVAIRASFGSGFAIDGPPWPGTWP